MGFAQMNLRHCRSIGLRNLFSNRFGVGKNFTFKDPNLNANDSICRFCFGSAVINIGTKSMKGYPPFLKPLCTRHLRTAKPAGAGNLNTLHAETEGRIYGFLHGAPEGDAALKLCGNILGDQLSVSFWTADFLNINKTDSLKLLFKFFF